MRHPTCWSPILFLLAMLGTPATAAHAGPGPWISEFGRRVLTQADQVVAARVESIQPAFRGITTARLTVTERLWGYDSDTTLLLLYVDSALAPDALGSTLESSTVTALRRRRAGLLKYLDDLRRLQAPRADEVATGSRETVRDRQRAPAPGGAGERSTGLRLAAEEEGIFFLSRSGASYGFVGYVPRSDPLFDVKRARLVELLRLEAIPSLDVRARDAKFSFLKDLASDQLWVRGHCAREIAALASRYPEIFTRGEAERIAKQLEVERDPAIATELETAVRVLAPTVALAWATRAEERERARMADELERARISLDSLRSPEIRAADVARVGLRYGRAATALVAVYLSDDSALVRESAARTLAEFGGPSARPALREALRTEQDAGVAQALVVACAAAGDPEAVFAIGERLTDPQLERAAVHALANLGTERAHALLRHHRLKCSEEVRLLIDTLLRTAGTRES